MELTSKKSVPFLKVRQIEHLLMFIEKYRGLGGLKKFDIFCGDMSKHIRLTNRRSLVNSIRYQFRQYLIAGKVDLNKKQEILEFCVRVLSNKNLTSEDLK